VNELAVEIVRLGQKQEDGTVTVPFGTLFKDEHIANKFEALVGTLRAAKKRGVLSFQGELLLSPVHDKVIITLSKDHVPAS